MRSAPKWMVLGSLLVSGACASAPPEIDGSAGIDASRPSDAGPAIEDASTIDAAAADGAVIDAAIATGDAGACARDLDCPCGEVCAAGECVASDCSELSCPTGRTCTCTDGILQVDGRTGTQWPAADVVVRRRPLTAADDGTDLVLRGYGVHDVTNQKGVHVTRCESTSGWRYREITLSCLDIRDVNRDAAGMAAGLHMDFIKIDGCMDGPSSDVTLEDIVVRGGNVYSLISDARIGRLVLRRVVHEADGALQIGTLTRPDEPMAGRIDEILVEDSPGLRTALLGTKIGIVRVVRSPGYIGGMGSAIPVEYDAESCPTRALTPNESCI